MHFFSITMYERDRGEQQLKLSTNIICVLAACCVGFERKMLSIFYFHKAKKKKQKP